MPMTLPPHLHVDINEAAMRRLAEVIPDLQYDISALLRAISAA